jgi:hypothetical protein
MIMKKILAVFAVLLFVGTLAQAQPIETKKWELGTAISYTSLRYSEPGYASSTYMWSVPIRVGYFVWKGLEIEPELMLTKFKGGDTAWLLGGHLVYNFLAPKNFVPFVLAGISFGNGISYAGLIEGSSDVHSTAPHFGAGLKYVVGSSAAVRLEYRYTHYRLTGTVDDGGSETYDSHQVFLGVSIFF